MPNAKYDEAVALSPDAQQLAGSTLWDVSGTTPKHVVELNTRQALAFSPDGTRLIDGSSLLDSRTGQRLEMVIRDESDSNHLTGLRSAAFSFDNKLLATTDDTDSSRRLHLWDGSTGKFIRRVTFEPFGADFTAVSFVPQEMQFAAVGSALWTGRISRVGKRSTALAAALPGPRTALWRRRRTEGQDL